MPANNSFPLPIPREHPCYAAHFPGNPIVPGALLLQWILRLLQQQLPGVQVSGVRTVKFLSVVKPEDDCLLTVEQNAGSTKLKIQLQNRSSLALKGTLDIRTFMDAEPTEQ